MHLRTIISASFAILASACSGADNTDATAPAVEAETMVSSAGIMLREGYVATIFHEGIGAKARHMAVAANGDLYVARREGEIVVLRDTDGDGIADEEKRRAAPITTGVAIRNNWIYFSDTTKVSRIKIGTTDALSFSSEIETVVSGFPEQSQHAEKAIAFDDKGGMFVHVGAPSNACMKELRTAGSPGLQPCPQLDRQAGIWRFSAETIGQTQTDGERWITGSRNAVALDWHDGHLLVAVHGRDQLADLWPDFYSENQNAELPAEEFHIAQKGDDFGWPYTYFNPLIPARVAAPEYGGDGATKIKGSFKGPDFAFPAHWAPNDLIAYDGGALIAFHGSWNRPKGKQAGYKVVWLPISNGEVSGDPIIFADGFMGDKKVDFSYDAAHRPTGLALGPDGAVYISDTVEGRIWKIVKQ